MTEKTFKQRVRDEAIHFEEVYADFKNDILARGFAGQSAWEHLFFVPFGNLLPPEKPSDEARRALNVPHRYDAARRTIQNLGLDELLVGPLLKNDLRISALLEIGLLTPDETVPPSGKHDGEFGRLVKRLKAVPDDPIFWRALLEVFCRAFISTPGQRTWKLEDYIELAFDLDEIRRESPAARWKAKSAKEKLRRRPYVERYKKEKLGIVGEDRIRRITDLIGPMDDGALERLKKLFPEPFFEVDDRRWRRQTKDSHGAVGLLDIGETVGDALTAVTEPEDDG
ncbi:hypothetical protein J4G48_0046890 [Bradyrhizobium barranii subsp. apii]|uniref:hypothetical protein n=1 Tax=Bradyrhizobium barranii TaxID=2992140 RepID=UPI001AA11D49|nr:hypothetical protein [Bradyrhizobium barranii]UPT96452.1 hypothetical protein J4G48_0046890 [Bradyrhizobium barranii subsp. apii]